MLWILIQNATWTPDWLHHPIWQMSADALDRQIDGSISVNRELTSLALLRLITAASVFWIAIQLCRDASRAGFLLWSIAAISCAYAAYGLFALGLTPGRILWFEKPAFHQALSLRLSLIPTRLRHMPAWVSSRSVASY